MNSNIKNIISALVLTGFSVTGAFAQTTVNINVDGGESSGGDSFQVAMMRNPNDSNLWMINDAMTRQLNDIEGDDVWTNETNRMFQGTQASFQINSITYSENPFITFDFSVTDIDAPSTFGFSFSTPITLAAGPTEVFSSIGGSITDGFDTLGGGTPDGATLTPNSPSSPDSSLLTADVDGIPLTNAELGFVSVDDPAGFPTTAFFGFDTGASPLAGPTLAAAASTLRANVDFTLTGDDDSVAMTGRVDINAVPEPSTYTLIAALGAASFVFIFRKRK